MTQDITTAEIDARQPGLLVMVRSLVFVIAFYSTTTVFLILGSPLLLAPRAVAMAGLAVHAQTCIWLLRVICRIGLEIRGRQHLPASACLVAAKHQSTWDTFALVPLLHDPAIVLKAELLHIPVYGWFCRKFEHIAIARERAAVALRQLVADANARIADGRQILVFPEGTRRSPGARPDYKPGIVALYETLGVPCVPIALNSGVFWPRRSLWRYPGRIVVEILPPIPPGLPRREFRDRLTADIETACARLVAEARGEHVAGQVATPSQDGAPA
jgi:1-acyl-sn-glycerol-3-phosphate acyltransferase